MKVTDVRAVIAIGLRGQFGLRGRLPWEGNRGREYVADVERFFELTRGHVVIMGQRTFTSVPDFAFKDRDILEINVSDRRRKCWRAFRAASSSSAANRPSMPPMRLSSAIGTSTGCRITARPIAGRSRLARRGRPSSLVLRYVELGVPQAANRCQRIAALV